MPFSNKIAYINLNTEEISYETISEDVRKMFLGGRGINAYILYKMVKPETASLSPDNPLVIGTGLLTGIKGPATARCSIGGKSPETGYYGDSNIGGHFPTEMKRCGFDCIVITGEASRVVNILITNNKIEIVDGSKYWGKDTYEVQEEFKAEYGTSAKFLCIGPAGENLVRYACIRSGHKNAAGRTGLGCLMGSKKIKGIIAHNKDKNTLDIHKPEEYDQYFKEIATRIKEEPMIEGLMTYGTNWLYDVVNEGVKVARTYNGLSNIFPDAENIGPKYLKEFFTGKKSCFSCEFACRHTYKVKEGKYSGTTGEGPEYGIMANFGPLLGITRLEPILAANDLVNKYGLDSSSIANMIAWAMELYDRGIITKEDTGGLALEWGNDDVLIELIEQITFRKGFGNILAEGAKGASNIIGHGSAKYISMVKNLPQSCATDMRYFRGFALGMATATRGADHLRSRAFYEPLEFPAETLKEIYGTDVDSKKDGYLGKGRVVQWWEAYLALFDATGICKLIGFAILPYCFMFEEFRNLIALATGIDLSVEEMFDVGERITTMERLFIAREGIRREDDTLPDRFFEPLEWGNSADGQILHRDKFQEMLTEYYQWHGWDTKTGIPTMETLERLNITKLFKKDELEITE